MQDDDEPQRHVSKTQREIDSIDAGEDFDPLARNELDPEEIVEAETGAMDDANINESSGGVDDPEAEEVEVSEPANPYDSEVIDDVAFALYGVSSIQNPDRYAEFKELVERGPSDVDFRTYVFEKTGLYTPGEGVTEIGESVIEKMGELEDYIRQEYVDIIEDYSFDDRISKIVPEKKLTGPSQPNLFGDETIEQMVDRAVSEAVSPVAMNADQDNEKNRLLDFFLVAEYDDKRNDEELAEMSQRGNANAFRCSLNPLREAGLLDVERDLNPVGQKVYEITRDLYEDVLEARQRNNRMMARMESLPDNRKMNPSDGYRGAEKVEEAVETLGSADAVDREYISDEYGELAMPMYRVGSSIGDLDESFPLEKDQE